MDLQYYRYFICLAEELHFGRAAEKLHITQPVLSIQIKKLEAHLGGQLFTRNQRHVALTDTGRALLNHARQILDDNEAFLKQAKKLIDGDAGQLSISYSGLAAYTGVMGSILRRFRQQYPHIHIQLEEHTPCQQLESLESGHIHLGFMTTLGITLPASMTAIFLNASPLTFIFPQYHRFTHQAELNYHKLSQEPFVVYAAGDDPGTAVIEHICGFSPQVAHRASTPLLLPSLVSAGLGIALIPTAFNHLTADDNIIVHPPKAGTPAMDISLVWKHNQTLSPAMKNFLILVQQEWDAPLNP